MARPEGSARAAAGIACVALAAALFTAGSFVAPRLEVAGRGGASALRGLYAPVCHQLPERSFEVGGSRQAVCARCSGLYLGGVAGLGLGALAAFSGRWRLRSWWLAAASLPTVLDAALPWIGLPGATNFPRLVLALPLGAIAGLFLARGLEDLFGARPAAPVEQASPVACSDSRR